MDKEHMAIERLKEASKMSLEIYKQPLTVTTSGGKDSGVCIALAQVADIPFKIKHHHTTADAPETVAFVRKEFKRLKALGIECTIDYPTYKGERTSMWKLIPQMGIPPTRFRRYCCEVLKERRDSNSRFIVTGVRWAESSKRKNDRGIYETVNRNKDKRIILNNDNDERRMLFESCALKATRICNPIIDWTDDDIWEYTRAENIPINPLYECGFNRIGCLGCPMASTKTRQWQFARYPKYKDMYISAFDRLIAKRKADGKMPLFPMGNVSTGKDLFHYWMEDGIVPGQVELGEYEVYE